MVIGLLGNATCRHPPLPLRIRLSSLCHMTCSDGPSVRVFLSNLRHCEGMELGVLIYLVEGGDLADWDGEVMRMMDDWNGDWNGEVMLMVGCGGDGDAAHRTRPARNI